MAFPVLTGAVLVEANGAALNNAGLDSGQRTDNAVTVKQVRVGRLRYPYVSGQAWRRWWREVLYQDYGWTPSEVIRQPNSAYTLGDPVRYEEDDVFGYMAARRRGQGQGTQRRTSPLKNSLLISVLPNVITRDFGHFSRNLPPEKDPVLYESEHYTSYLQGAFTVALLDVGRFEVGEMRDLAEEAVRAASGQLSQADGSYFLPLRERARRVRQLLSALGRLRGGAHLARNLSDVTPVAVLLAFVDGGNAPFQRLFEADANMERVVLNVARLRSVLHDYKDRLLGPEGEAATAVFSARPGVLGNEEEVAAALRSDELLAACIRLEATPLQAIERVATWVEAVFERYVRP